MTRHLKRVLRKSIDSSKSFICLLALLSSALSANGLEDHFSECFILINQLPVSSARLVAHQNGIGLHIFH